MRQWPEAEKLNVIVVLNAIFQICKSTPGAAGPRSACGRAVGSFIPRYAGVPGDPDDSPVDGAVPKESQEGLHQGRVYNIINYFFIFIFFLKKILIYFEKQNNI